MPEIVEQREDPQENRPAENGPDRPRRARRYVTGRNASIAGGLLAVVVVFFILLAIVTYRYGVFDPYIKEQFTAKMADIGIVFDAEVFRVTVAPLELELRTQRSRTRSPARCFLPFATVISDLQCRNSMR